MRVQTTPRPATHHWLLICWLVFGLIIASYFVWRYNGQWMEGDSQRVTYYIETLIAEGKLAPSQGIYQHGFGYQMVSALLVQITGLSPQTLQAVVYPYVAMLGLGLTAFVFYRRMTGNVYLALLAGLWLFLQPDILFVTMRGSHEKLDWPLTLLALAFFYLSTESSWQALVAYVGLFYLVIFAKIATNVFFASTFLTALLLGLLVGVALWTWLRWRAIAANDLRRLIYMVAACGVTTYVFIVYIYPITLSNFQLLQTIADKLSALFLSFEIQSQPYNYIAFAWLSSEVYLGLTIFTWLLIAGSLVEWARRGKNILLGQERFGLRDSIDWLLYTGFALQVGISIVIDFTGFLGNNLQLRVFPGFVILAVGMLARGLGRLLAWFRQHRRPTSWLVVVLSFATAWFAITAVFKSTNEPLLGNKWVFYTVSENMALQWAEDNLRYTSIWAGFDERLQVALYFQKPGTLTSGNRYLVGESPTQYSEVLFSETEKLRANRIELPMPTVLNWLRTYDNGEVQFYHRRPLTPYQR